ncbi:MAG: peptide/nickel transport system substrate-binding protein [Thermoleophilaceae bacterium]|jgi:peptide/nickel transport system substrate-binding protein|nr:peptide/nickel transport system substrate-binding protein [Thermoleophilaceae bacterium]
MHRGGRRRSLVIGLALMALAGSGAFSGCADDDDDGGGGSGKAGGTIRISHLLFPDYLDPALSYTVDGWQALQLVYPGLVTFPHDKSGAASAEVVPGLAESLPEISEDGRTYEFQLREDLRFSDGTPLRASDFKASIERILASGSQGIGLGYDNIAKIQVDDASGRITIRLKNRRGQFLYELAIPFGGVVPADTPAKNQTNSPPPGAGRYRIVDVNAPRTYSLVRNENFSEGLEGTAVDAGHVDRIDAVVMNEANAATQISQGKLDFMVDNPPSDRLAEIRAKYPDRYREFGTNSTYFFFLNTEVPPFDKLAVRQAANHVVDPEAISRIFGGTISAAHTVLPPGVPGHPGGDDLYPTDMDRAKELIREAGAEGADVAVITNPVAAPKNAAEYYADQLTEAGLDAEVKVLGEETYFSTIGSRSLKPQTGFTNFFQDYPHPANFLDRMVNPDSVSETASSNLAYNAGDEQLADRIEELNQEPELTDDVKRRWGEIDRYAQEQALMAIYGNKEQATFFSEKMDFENCKGDNHAVYTHDWHGFCLK